MCHQIETATDFLYYSVSSNSVGFRTLVSSIHHPIHLRRDRVGWRWYRLR